MAKTNEIPQEQKQEIEHIKKQKVRITKIVLLFNLIWILAVVVPASRWVYRESASIKNYLIVRSVYESNKALLTQYKKLTTTLTEKININQYTQNIKLPEIKLDEISETTGTISKAASITSKFGISGADKIAKETSNLQKQIDKINEQIQTETKNLQKTLESDLNKAIKTELDKLADEQMQELLRLSDTNYKNLINNNYGYLTKAQRNSTNAIYQNFVKADTPILKSIAEVSSKYYKYIQWLLLAITIILTLIPVFYAFKISRFITQSFNHCPYCGKYFLTKTGKLNILLFFKFW